MNIYEQMSKNLYNPNAQSGEDIQKMLNMQSGYGQQGQQGQNTSNLDYALLANAITPFTSQQGGGQGSGGYMNPATSGMMGNIGSLGKQFAGNVGLFSPWNQSTTAMSDAAGGGFGGGVPYGLMMSGQSDYSNPYSGYVQGIGDIIPGLGTVLGGMLNSIIGKDAPLGAGLDEYYMALSAKNNMWSDIYEKIAKANTGKYGLDLNNLQQLYEPPNSMMEWGLTSGGQSEWNWTPEAWSMISKELPNYQYTPQEIAIIDWYDSFSRAPFEEWAAA